METVDVYTINGDFVTCSGCGKVMLLPHGADRCQEYLRCSEDDEYRKLRMKHIAKHYMQKTP